jgi:hypothetical protein
VLVEKNWNVGPMGQLGSDFQGAVSWLNEARSRALKPCFRIPMVARIYSL